MFDEYKIRSMLPKRKAFARDKPVETVVCPLPHDCRQLNMERPCPSSIGIAAPVALTDGPGRAE